MTTAELELELKTASTDERVLTKKIVELVAEALRRKIWAERGYASAHRWLVVEFGYSDSSAGRRLDAARFLDDVPEVAEKLATGELTLSSLSQLQSAIHQEEKRTGEKVTAEAKKEVVKKIENQSSAAASRTVSAEFPEVSKAPRESLKPAGVDGWTLTCGLDSAQKAALDRARELLSHSHPGATWAALIAHLASEHGKRADPLARVERREAKASKMPQGFTATEDVRRLRVRRPANGRPVRGPYARRGRPRGAQGSRRRGRYEQSAVPVRHAQPLRGEARARPALGVGVGAKERDRLIRRPPFPVRRYARSDRDPHSSTRNKLRSVYKLLGGALKDEDDRIVQLGFQGQKPELNDEAPARALRDDFFASFRSVLATVEELAELSLNEEGCSSLVRLHGRERRSRLCRSPADSITRRAPTILPRAPSSAPCSRRQRAS